MWWVVGIIIWIVGAFIVFSTLAGASMQDDVLGTDDFNDRD
jgi:hypothetical protein